MQAGDGRPSYDELAALVIEQARVIAELPTRVAAVAGGEGVLSTRAEATESPVSDAGARALPHRAT